MNKLYLFSLSVFFTLIYSALFAAGPTITSFAPGTGAIGSSVVITGTGFSTTLANNNVTFGTITATVTAATSTQLTVTVPVGSATQAINVTVSSLTASSSTNFTAYSAPIISSFSPASGAIGTTVTITGANFNTSTANNIVFFGASRATVTSASATQLQVTVPAGASFQPISVINTSTSLSAYSSLCFLVTYLGKNSITDQDIDLQTTISAAGTSPGQVFSADLNGDGLPDMVVLNDIAAANNVSIYIHNSSYTSYTNAYPTTPTYYLSTPLNSINQWGSILAADVDGDGKPDLLVAPYNANAVYLYLSSTATGGALFGTTPLTVNATNVPKGIAVGDLDGDGKIDIAVTNGSASTVSVLRNTSTGGITSFATQVAISNGASIQAFGIAIADIDGDGKPDMVTCNQSTSAGAGSISIIRNVSAPGPFSATSGVSFITPTSGANTIIPTGISTVTTKPFNLAVGDLDGDGKVDIAVTNYQSNSVAVFRNTSNTNSFSFDNATSSSATTTINNTTYTTGTAPVSVSIADMDGDGKPDLVVSNYNSATVSVLRNITTQGATLGSTSFAAKVDYAVGSQPGTISIQDIDGDGKPDVLVPNYTSNSISILHNAPAIAPVITSFTPKTGAQGTSMTITGSNFSANAASNSVYFGGVKTTATSATATQLTVTIPTGAQYGTVAVQNTNATHPVIAYSSAAFTPTFISKNNITAGDFDARIDILNTISGTNYAVPKSIVIADIDGDGKPDVIFNQGSQNVFVFRQSTSSSGSLSSAYFDTPLSFSFGSNNLTLLSIADIDGDGKPDLTCAANNASNNRVVVLRNTSTAGSVSFAASVNITTPTGGTPNGITFADLDGDGRLDMIVTNTATNNISVFRNISTAGTISATATFAAGVTFATRTYPYAVKAGDIDGDGKIDLVVTNAGDNTISVFRNTSTVVGTIAFSPTVPTFATGIYPEIPFLGDLDGDGKIDIVVPNFGTASSGVIQNTGTAGTGNTISVFHNTSTIGTLNFDAQQTFTTGTAPVIAALADMDGDGKADVLIGNNASKTVSILRNTSTSGSISLAAKVDLTTTTGGNPNITGIAAGDLDGDGKPDIAIANNNNPGSISFFRNDPTIPLVTTSTGNVTFTSTGGTQNPVAIDGALTVTEANRTTLASATISITGGLVTTEDVLAFNNDGITMGNIAAGTYDSTNGVLTLTSAGGTATLAQFQAALRAVTYINTNTVPTQANRTISFAVNDGSQTGPSSTKTLVIVSANANLSVLSLSAGTLSPVFASATYSYTASVANNVTSISLTPVAAVSLATIKVNGVGTTSGSTSANIPLSVGSNTITVVTTGQDGTTTATYSVTITRQPSSNANLANIVLSSGEISPVFDGGTTGYSATVANNVNAIAVTPTVADATATITVNGVAVSSGSASANTALNVGPNTITIAVTAQDGLTTVTYTVTVNRLPSSNAMLAGLSISGATLTPTFSGSTYNYGALVPNATTSITITPTLADATATITVNGTNVVSGSPSAIVALAVGTNTITVVVTAQDGTTQLTYTTTVTRISNDATLTGLVISSGTLSPVFSAATTSYTASVLNTVTSINLTPTVNQANATVKINGNTVASGVPSGEITLNVGTNTILTIVTAQDGTTNSYTVVITRPQSPDATLSALVTSAGPINPSFVSGTTSYTVSVANSVTSATISPTVNESNATVKVNGTLLSNGSTSGSISLVVGTNPINVLVTAQDGTQKTYNISITRAASSNASLSALSISNGTLTPTFSTATLNYSAGETFATTSITVTPIVADATATVKVNGVAVASGTPSGAITLNNGSNSIAVVVTAQDGSFKTYSLNVLRSLFSNNADLSALSLSNGTLSPVFSAATTSGYSASVANSVSSIMVVPSTADANATIQVNGITTTSGSASAAIALAVGNNTITTTVSAQDGITQKTYTITVNRAQSSNANLVGLIPSSGTLSPVFASATNSYSLSVANNITAITLTPTVADATATVKVNGNSVSSGSVSALVSLAIGTNTITTTVTAQDGTINTYTITVTRAQSSNANLSSLVPSSGVLSPVFAAGTNSYTLSVANSITAITFTVAVADATATVKVNGTAVSSGSASGNINLLVGNNTITTTITAQDGTVNTYTIVVSRAASSNNNLSALSMSNGTLSPVFAPGTNSYIVAVGGSITSVTLSPLVADATATVTINGTSVNSGSSSAAIPLNLGSNTISTVVTAQNGTTNTYTIVVNRQIIAQTITFAAMATVTYGSGDVAPAATSTNNTIPITYSSSNTSVATITAGGNIHIVGAGTASITASQSGNADYSAAAPISQNLTVNTAILTIAAVNQSKVYGTANPAFTLAYSGFVNGDTQAGLTTQAIASTTATAASGVGTYPITASGAASANYTIAYTNGTLTVTPAALNIAANNQTKVYGSANPLVTFTYSGFVNGDTQAVLTTQPSAVSSANLTSGVGTYPITPSGAASANYTIGYTSGTLTVTQATLNISANNQTKVYGSANPTLTLTYSGFLNGDTPAGLSAQANASTTATAASGVGTYPITVSGAVSANYTITYTSGTLTVSQAIITVTAANQNKLYGAALPALTASYSGFVNGDTQTSLGLVPSFSTTATPASAAGTYQITVAGTTLVNYTVVTVAGTMTIAPAVLTISGSNVTATYGSVAIVLSTNYSGFVNGDTPASLKTAPTISTTATPISKAGTYPITVSGAVSSNYTFVYIGATFTILPSALVITANNFTKIYGTANPTLTVSYSGFVNGDTQTNLTTQPTVSTTAVTTSLPGTYPITVSGAASANYTITYVSGTLTVGVIPRTLTFNPIISQTYGNADFDPGATVSSGDPVVYTTSDNTIATVVNNKIHIVTAGTVTIYATVTARANYADVAIVSQKLIINKASQIIAFYPIPVQQKGGTPFNLNLTASSGLPVTLTSSDPTTASIDPVTQAISPLGIGAVVITAVQPGNINYLPISATEVLKIEGQEDLVFVRPGFSPNNDGINDVMIIEGIKDYPDNDITIVDRNGAKYYHASNYDNTSVVFDGRSSITGDILRPGTYFYVLNYKVNGQSRRKAGYIIIKY